MKIGWIATSGDGSECGHHHRTRLSARRCVVSQIYAGKRDVQEEAREHGMSWRAYVDRWVNDAIYYRGPDGNLHREAP